LENHRFGNDLPWFRLIEMFNLSPSEEDLLLVAIAPELDVKYETIYAYLNNDVARKWPTCELALRVMAAVPDMRMVQRSLLLPHAKLFDQGILRWIPPSGDRPRLLAGTINIAPVVINYLLDQHALDHELAPFAKLYVPHRSGGDVRVHPSVEKELQSLSRQF